MPKETSPEISSLGGIYMRITAERLTEMLADDPAGTISDIRGIAASAVSQDRTPGQDPPTFLDRLKRERSQLAVKAGKLELFIERGMSGADADQRELLKAQLSAMNAYLAILDMRLAKLQTKPRVASEPELGEPVEVGGHDEDRDGPVSFGA